MAHTDLARNPFSTTRPPPNNKKQDQLNHTQTPRPLNHTCWSRSSCNLLPRRLLLEAPPPLRWATTPSMKLPHLGGETEDPTPLPSGPPPGPTNKLPEHSSPANREQHESSSVAMTAQDYSTQWGTTQWGIGKFSTSWGTHTLPPSEPWAPYHTLTSTQHTEQETEEEPSYLSRVCSLCETPMATFHPFQPLTCFACTKILQDACETDHTKTRHTHEERGDEEEFQFKGIPIAGENYGDSVESRESVNSGENEQEEDNLSINSNWLSPVTGINLPATNDIAFRVGPTKDGVIQINTLSLPSLYTSISTAHSWNSPTTCPLILPNHHHSPIVLKKSNASFDMGLLPC
jgi:hypothetical protein